MNNSRPLNKYKYAIKHMVKRFIKDDVTAFAAESTYYFILGLVPFLVFFTNVILFFAAPQIQVIIKFLHYLPQQLEVSMAENIYRIIQGRSTVWLAIGLFGALWTSSQGINVIIRAMDKIFFKNRNIQNWITVSIKSLLFTLLITFSLILSLGMIVFANALIYVIAYYFGIPEMFLEMWNIAKYAIPFTMMIFSLAAFYRFAPAKKCATWPVILVTSLFVTGILLLLTGIYGYYILEISKMGATYGSLIGLVVLFIWFRLASMVILTGSECIMTCEEIKNIK